jgi:glutamate racemase
MPDDRVRVVFCDSGVGGLPYLAQARAALPQLRMDYFADRQGFPYGNKPPDMVVELVSRAMTAIVAQLCPAAVVLACNTATQLAITVLRQNFPYLSIIGTVPAVKPAARLSRTGRIAVLATERAAADPYLVALAAQWAPDCHVERIGVPALVEFVENRLIGSSADERLAAVRPAVHLALDAGADAIVLGCTHFVHLARAFSAVAGPDVSIVDSRAGVCMQLASKLVAASTDPKRTVVRGAMYLSGQEPFGAVHESFARLFDLEPAGILYA